MLLIAVIPCRNIDVTVSASTARIPWRHKAETLAAAMLACGGPDLNPRMPTDYEPSRVEASQVYVNIAFCFRGGLLFNTRSRDLVAWMKSPGILVVEPLASLLAAGAAVESLSLAHCYPFFDEAPQGKCYVGPGQWQRAVWCIHSSIRRSIHPLSLLCLQKAALPRWEDGKTQVCTSKKVQTRNKLS